MNKKIFIKHIKRIRELHIIEDKIQTALNLLTDQEGLDVYFNLDKPITFMIDILKDTMNDTFDNIPYFIYDLDFGKNKMAKNCITEKDGKKISLQTPAQLYNYLQQIN